MIEFKSVSFSYEKKGRVILNDINLTIDKGELVAIVGKNGAGKSTLIKHVNGLLRPTAGEVFVNGENIQKKRLSEMATIVGLAFQNPNHQLFAETVQKELEFGPKNLGINDKERKELAYLMAEQFQITHLLEKNPLELSGGERRLVSIASVLTMNQQILILDEPSFGQDYRQKNRLGNYLQDLRRKGMTVLIVSHDIDFILEFIPRIVVLNNGNIIADGYTKDILMNKLIIEEADLDTPILLDLQEELMKNFASYKLHFEDSSFYENIKQLLVEHGK
ncbi:MAG: ABC transporter ATP-binding protein [Candidatus Heimdallarchaeota archaeon]|nr:ABC transporter ATP-binding protein [Candidatus Heimdallarchaeota archaeon]